MIISTRKDLPSIWLLLVFLILFTFRDNAYGEFLSVQGDKITLLSSPDQKSKPLWEYGNGFPLQIIKKQGDWLMVKDFEDDSGWILRSRLQKSKQVIVKANKDKDKTINIRSGPSTSSPIVGNAFYGVVLSVLERNGFWVQIRHESGLSGWVKADLLWGL
jgi:SH3-like domain-containing protein